jgi:hypothetical protein
MFRWCAQFLRDKCLDIIKLFDTFSIEQIPREENSRVIS